MALCRGKGGGQGMKLHINGTAPMALYELGRCVYRGQDRLAGCLRFSFLSPHNPAAERNIADGCAVRGGTIAIGRWRGLLCESSVIITLWALDSTVSRSINTSPSFIALIQSEGDVIWRLQRDIATKIYHVVYFFLTMGAQYCMPLTYVGSKYAVNRA